MAESRRYGLGTQLDIEQILVEAQHRWLRPAEICEILRNFKKFRIAPEPAHKPPSGSLFLFDRKVLRYFRKDGHNWRKKKDGKTVKEAHERLKAGSIDVLHCYYAHGEENENFQRRSYWLLEEEHSHIVLVHYREVKGHRANFNRIKEAEEAIPNSQESEEIVSNSEVYSSVSSKFKSYNYQVTSQTTDTSLNSTQASEYEDAESAYNHQESSGFHSFLELQPRAMEKMEDGVSVPYYPVPFSNDYLGKLPGVSGMDFGSLTEAEKGKNSVNAALTYPPEKHLDFPSWEDVLENSGTGIQSVPFQPSLSANRPDTMSFNSGRGNEPRGQFFTEGFSTKQEVGSYPHHQDKWQTSEDDSSHISKWSLDPKLHKDSSSHLIPGLRGEGHNVDLLNSAGPRHEHPSDQNKHYTQTDFQMHLTYGEGGAMKSELESNLTVEGKAEPSPLKQPLLDGLLKEGLKKLDSFDRWMSKELGDVNESHVQSSSGTYWETVEAEDGVDDSSIASQAHLGAYMLGPSLSQDQLFSIIDFSPNWAYAGSEIKVLITGKFLTSQQDLEKCKWSCMFGEVEVPAEIIADGVLRCHTPLHNAGRVPFYVTCSNRLACSEVREFEYRVNNIQDADILDTYYGSTNEILLGMRFGNFLSLESASPPSCVSSPAGENSHLSSKISALLKEDNNEWEQMLMLTSEDDFSPDKIKEQLLQKLLKEKLHVWLLQKVAEGGKGPSVLDEDGQGVLHFAAALGYDWAIPPTLAAGVSINFRDVNGWTALHWAASCGRERTVGFLISLDAAPGALSDPTPIHPSGQTPADVAASNGHKGIAGYLAESSLSSHLSSLQLKDNKEGGSGETSGVKVVQAVSERTATPIMDGDLAHGLSLKDSLAAVCNATQAAARIHQVFRVQSFQRKQIKEYGDDKFGMSEERALSLVAVKSKSRLGHHDEPVQAAAIRIQNKFRSWKGRKEFLTIRQQIVKIQAHVRGHQVRKNYRKITWSVGIVEKIILRWRRKGSGLRGFKQEALPQASSKDMSSKEDDYDFLKEGRKQTEERLQKALARVKSMVQYPEARDQYRRLLNVVTEMQETKAVYDKVLNSTEEVADFDDLIDLEALLDDDTFMPTLS
ncbi:Calmodulin-binding transcription activator 3 like [Actinidia chinensis var. chinensis]|uniref:Calmodulin-binding transcription activator 3 like n=1 Tax=Actinidia chinensis var. chinensis TaxID=1590841 RepID=A0A2R6RDE6_ACTCC|nr:Calmodulin-binding transcription activator 3 like [Actinidia chinensis var. chinensis]